MESTILVQQQTLPLVRQQPLEPQQQIPYMNDLEHLKTGTDLLLIASVTIMVVSLTSKIREDTKSKK